MLTSADLKKWLQKELAAKEKLLLLLASFDNAASISKIRQRAVDVSFLIPARWNISDTLGRAKGLVIRTTNGWEVTDAGKQHLRNLGVTKLSPAAVQIATDLRTHLTKVTDNTNRTFVEEAVKCYEAELYRSAIVMSWLSAVDVLHKHVHAKHLAAFNAEAKRVDIRWKDAQTPDDLGRMGESDFLDRLAAISVLAKNVKTALKDCLDRRNGCGHPNSLKIGANTVAHHIEILLLNVFQVF